MVCHTIIVLCSEEDGNTSKIFRGKSQLSDLTKSIPVVDTYIDPFDQQWYDDNR